MGKCRVGEGVVCKHHNSKVGAWNINIKHNDTNLFAVNSFLDSIADFGCHIESTPKNVLVVSWLV